MSEPKQIETKKAPISIALAAAAVLVIGGGIISFWSIVQRRSAPDVPVGTEILPQDALMAISLTTDESQWRKLREFGTPESQALLDRYLLQLRDRFLSVNGYNYQQDIQPWVGSEITVGFLPPFPVPIGNDKTDSTPSAARFSGQHSVVMVLPINNSLRAKQVLEKAQPPQNGRWVNRTYKDVEIKQMQGVPEENQYAVTVLDGRYLVISNDSPTISRIIDTYKGAPALADMAGATKVWQRLEASRPFARLFINVPIAAAVASLNSANPNPKKIATQQHNQGFASTLTLESDGIGLDSMAWLKPDSELKYTVENNARTMATRLPADTLMMISGSNLQQLWSDYTAGVDANPISPLDPQWLRRSIKSTTNLDLEKDLLSWMAGEFSFSIVPPVEGSNARYPIGVLFMVQASDRRAGEETLKKLDRAMSEEYNFTVEETQLASQPVVQWTSPQKSLSVTYGWLNGNVAFLSFLAPVGEAIVPAPKQPLAMSEQFQDIVPLELTPNNGYFFMDVERAIQTETPSWIQLPSQQQILIDAIQAIGVSTAVESDRTTRYQVFVRLNKAGKPKPLPTPAGEDPQNSTPPSAPATPSDDS